MENLLVKTIGSVDYVKAMDVANHCAKNKNYHSAIRFIHKTFAESDIVKTNATLYVKKFAVEKYFYSGERIKLLEKQVSILEQKNVRCEQECKKFKDELVKEYQKHIRAMHEIDVPSYTEILLLLRGENEDFSAYAHKKLERLEKIFCPIHRVHGRRHLHRRRRGLARRGESLLRNQRQVRGRRFV